MARNRECGMTGILTSPSAVKRHDIVATLRKLMTDQALPLWAGEGWDSSRGGFVERLDPEEGRIGSRRAASASRRGRSIVSPWPRNSAGIRMRGGRGFH